MVHHLKTVFMKQIYDPYNTIFLATTFCRDYAPLVIIPDTKQHAIT
jgi:hypothetical protein